MIGLVDSGVTVFSQSPGGLLYHCFRLPQITSTAVKNTSVDAKSHPSSKRALRLADNTQLEEPQEANKQCEVTQLLKTTPERLV